MRYSEDVYTMIQEARLPDPFSPELLLALEEVEAAFCRDLYDAAPPGAQLHHMGIGAGRAFFAPEADVLALNRAVAVGLRTPLEPGDLDRLIEAYREAGVPRFFVQVSPAAGPPALYRWLAERGFERYNNWTKLFRPLDDRVPEEETDLRIQRIDPTDAAPFGQMVAPHFDWPSPMDEALAGTVGRPGWRHYFAYDGDVPVAAAGLFTHGGYAYLGPAVTLETHRRRGAQSALIARRLRDAVQMDCHTALSDTAEERPDKPVPSYRNMRRLGFRIAYVRPNYLYTF